MKVNIGNSCPPPLQESKFYIRYRTESEKSPRKSLIGRKNKGCPPPRAISKHAPALKYDKAKMTLRQISISQELYVVQKMADHFIETLEFEQCKNLGVQHI